MPLMTVEQLKQRETRLTAKLAEQGGSLDPARLRKLKKQIRRTQRRRRSLLATAERHAAKRPAAADKPAEDKPAEDKPAE